MREFPLTLEQFEQWLWFNARTSPRRVLRNKCSMACVIAEALHDSGLKTASVGTGLQWGTHTVAGECEFVDDAEPLPLWAKAVVRWFDRRRWSEGGYVYAETVWKAYAKWRKLNPSLEPTLPARIAAADEAVERKALGALERDMAAIDYARGQVERMA